MALNKSSKFGALENLDFRIDAQDVQQAHVTYKAQEVQEVQKVMKEIGTTQGRKGHKLKRINMAFSDMNHEYITKESRRRGMSATAFVNMIIDEYRSENGGVKNVYG